MGLSWGHHDIWAGKLLAADLKSAEFPMKFPLILVALVFFFIQKGENYVRNSRICGAQGCDSRAD